MVLLRLGMVHRLQDTDHLCQDTDHLHQDMVLLLLIITTSISTRMDLDMVAMDTSNQVHYLRQEQDLRLEVGRQIASKIRK
jgi:hypothetical protein